MRSREELSLNLKKKEMRGGLKERIFLANYYLITA